MNPAKYHQILVLSPDGTTDRAWMDDRQLCDGLLKNSGATLEGIIDSSDTM